MGVLPGWHEWQHADFSHNAAPVGTEDRPKGQVLCGLSGVAWGLHGKETTRRWYGRGTHKRAHGQVRGCPA